MDWRLLLSFQLIGIKGNLASKSFEYFQHVSLCTNLCLRALFKLPLNRVCGKKRLRRLRD